MPTGEHLSEIDEPLLDEIIQNGLFAADQAVLGHTFLTRADETRAAVHAAFRLAARNGLITLAPRESWPEWISLDG